MATLFGYANLVCVAGEAAFESCDHHECEGSESGHHDQAPAKDCSKDACFCTTMNTVMAQQTVTQTNHPPLRVVDVTFAELSVTIPALRAMVAYEHGPPSIAPPQYRSSKTLSPRAPPLGA